MRRPVAWGLPHLTHARNPASTRMAGIPHCCAVRTIVPASPLATDTGNGSP